jgi:hypothetical protein
VTFAGAFSLDPIAAFLDKEGAPIERREGVPVTQQGDTGLRLGVLAELRKEMEWELASVGIESFEPVFAALAAAKVEAKDATVHGVVDLRHLGLEFLRGMLRPR